MHLLSDLLACGSLVRLGGALNSASLVHAWAQLMNLQQSQGPIGHMPIPSFAHNQAAGRDSRVEGLAEH